MKLSQSTLTQMERVASLSKELNSEFKKLEELLENDTAGMVSVCTPFNTAHDFQLYDKSETVETYEEIADGPVSMEHVYEDSSASYTMKINGMSCVVIISAKGCDCDDSDDTL